MEVQSPSPLKVHNQLMDTIEAYTSANPGVKYGDFISEVRTRAKKKNKDDFVEAFYETLKEMEKESKEEVEA